MIQLVNMPFGSIMRSSLALGLFKAQCGKSGLPARVHNLNFAFARCIGFGAYEMIARYVMPEFQELNTGRAASMEWVRQNKNDFTAQSRMAVGDRIRQHAEEKGAENLNPMFVKSMGPEKAKTEENK